MRFQIALVSIFTAILPVFVGCTNAKSDAVALRVAALTYAFEHDTETKAEPGNWVFSVDSDMEKEAVIDALSRYPITHTPLSIEDRGSGARVEVQTGKRYAGWRVEIKKNDPDEIWADVGCVKGGLNGYGQLLLMKKSLGRWIVVSSSRTWIS